jgi:hypothetical protein
MFTLVADGIQAFNQVGLFFGALACLGLAGLFLGQSLYWRLHAQRAAGTIIGVIERGGLYTPVYRYTLPDGGTHEAKSDTSSSSPRGKETGRVVPLLISPHDPTQAQEATSYLSEAIGLVLAIPGVWLGYIALTAYPITWMTWVMALVMLVYLAERGHRILIPKGQRLSIAQWRAQHGLGASAIDLSAVVPIESILAAPEARQKAQAQLKTSRWLAPVLGACAVMLLAVGMYQARDIARLQSSGLRAPGEVIRIKSEYSSGRNGGYNYYPIVRYRTERNETVEFKDSIGSNPPSYRPGDRVTVLYRADDPRDVIIDRGAFWNWAIPAVLLMGSVLLGLLALWIRRSGRGTGTSTGLAAPA